MHDAKFERAMQFAKRFKQKNGRTSISNVYVIQSIDRDGNVVDECYGMNLMTNYGMTQYFVNRNAFPTNLYIGNGSGSFNHTTNALLSPIVTTAASITSTTKSYAYPLYYDSISGIVTCVAKYMEVYFDYNITGIDGPVDVSEYGIGSAYNQLWTHSWVYNSVGDKSTVRKDLDTKLEITVYMCMSYDVSMITDGWENGKYIVITNPYRFFNQSVVTMNDTSLYTYRRYDHYERTKTHTTGYEDNIESITSNMGAFTLLPIDVSNTTANGYIDGFISWTSGFNMFERVEMPNPIAFDLVGKCSNDHFTDQYGLSNSFGDANQGIPFTQANVTASYTFNYKTGEYTCADHYLNDSRKWYTETSFDTNFATILRFTNNNETIEINLYQNINPDDPIVSFDTEATNLYATDAYWDTASWTRIQDLSAIPAALQNKMYWLTTDNEALNPVRGFQYFEFIASDGVTHAPSLGFRDTDFTTGFQHSYSYQSQSSKWFTIGNKIYIVSRGDLVVTSNGNRAFGYGNLVAHYTAWNSSTALYVTNISDSTPSASSVATLGSVQPGNARFSESGNGYFIMNEYSGNGRTLKLNLTGASVAQTLLDPAVDACCIPRSANYVYIDKTETRRVFIKKLSDDSLVKQIDIRSDYAAPTFVFGFRNYVYITDTSNYIYKYDITSDELTELDSTFPGTEYNTTNKSNAYMTCSNNCLILYNCGMRNNWTSAWMVLYDNPSQVVSLNGISDPFTSTDTYTKVDVVDINTDSILLIRQSSAPSAQYRNVIVAIDLGKFIQTGDTEYIVRNQNNTYPLVMWGEFGIYNNKSFPLANMLSHRLVGTTSCVSSCNGQKHISDKRWTVEVTNLGGYSGLPPGNKQ